MVYKMHTIFLKSFYLIVLTLAISSCNCNLTLPAQTEQSIQNNDILQLSADLLTQIKNQNNHLLSLEKLENLSIENLKNALNSDQKKMIFWINIYNAFIQLKLKEQPELYANRSKFFSKGVVNISGLTLSFDDIEHIILRGNELKFGLGHLKNPLTSKALKSLSVKSKDPRLHFALNCGAKSCPPIAIFTAKNYNTLIEKVSKYFLTENSTVNADKILVSPIFSWFRGDFCGEDGIKQYLKHYNILEAQQNLKLGYKAYNWDLSLGNYYHE